MKILKMIWSILSKLLLAAVLVGLFIVSIKVTKPDLKSLLSAAPRAKEVLGQLLKPKLIERKSEILTVSQSVAVPCNAIENIENSSEGPRIVMDPPCGEPKDELLMKGYDLPKNAEVSLRWILPDGGILRLKNIRVDNNGEIAEKIEIRPIVTTVDGVAAQLSLEVAVPSGSLLPTDTLINVVDTMMITIFMALIATTIGTVFSIPLSFLAASNITKKGVAGTGLYYLVRSLLNIVRSYEPLVLATVFAMIVGFGSPFAGVIALSITTAASLGKMFSEAVEHIDPGPIEALTSTGANKLQVIVFSVVPQIVPDFISYAIYHWDINVRISTIIGFVGGGGIGYLLSLNINTLKYSEAGTALLAIILVVWALDFLSTQVRKQII